ncbi:MAG: hypothetical protein QM776_15080 [Rhodocyclaceae bacterium]
MNAPLRPQPSCPAAPNARLVWALFGVWLLASLLGLAAFEYGAVLRGVLCLG